ncbi:MAG: hypothetical protein CVT48_06420 [Thermoplasmata archaeon HGW-Thermoplasmata-1]|nr:nucleotidyl transferase AbiEii/AbiGii toxin family protein [Candidatus Methanoperedens sp.]PKK85227.1 MAG: hypothetical protein CVT48_06420 [Thermoplasmata archaeon HGW-Thermoplasmata-1]
MADLETLRRLSAKTGLGLKYLSKDERVSIALEQLREIFPDVVLKGGTALNRVYLAKSGTSRFSEDIDLDFLSDAGLNEKISSIRERMPMLKGFDIDGPRQLHRTLRFDCGYVNEFGEKDRIRIEFYLTQTKFVSAEDVLVKSPFIETHPAIFRVYSLEDLVARKFAALYSRTEGKDFYDLFHALDLPMEKNHLAAALGMMLGFYRIGTKNFVEELIFKLHDAGRNAQYIGNSTNHFIPRSLRPEWRIFIESLAAKIRRAIGDFK